MACLLNIEIVECLSCGMIKFDSRYNDLVECLDSGTNDFFKHKITKSINHGQLISGNFIVSLYKVTSNSSKSNLYFKLEPFQSIIIFSVLRLFLVIDFDLRNCLFDETHCQKINLNSQDLVEFS